MLKMLYLRYAIIQTNNIKNTSTESQCTWHILTVIGGLCTVCKNTGNTNQNIEMLIDGGLLICITFRPKDIWMIIL